MSQLPDYYKLLNITKSASQDEIRQAYKKESLRTHPDRLANATAAERQQATEKFQAVADAYFVLSDTKRRNEYDVLYSTRSTTDDPNASSNFFANFANMFGGTAAGAAQGEPREGGARPDAEGVFADVFEELLRPEVERRVPVWTCMGAVCGAGIGFIVGNIPGAMIGGLAGNRLGAVRDAKGKSVAAVFNDLGGQQKAEVLRALAMKILGSAL